MSWSVTLVGTAEGVSKALDEYGNSISGQSQEEFLEAKPHLQALISQNLGGDTGIRLDANGHATFENGEKKYGTCLVRLESFYGKWCE